MSHRRMYGLSSFLVLFVAMLSVRGYAAQPNRIAAAVSNANRVQMQGTLNRRVSTAQDLGVASDDTRLSSMTLQFSMTTAQSAAMQQLQGDLLDPESGRYHQWLTPETYADQFGLSELDYATVTNWLTSQGFQIIAPSRTRAFVNFSGTAAQVRAAFGTPIHSVMSNGERHISNLQEPTVPAVLGGVVAQIHGLSDFKPRANIQTAVTALGSSTPNFTTSKGAHALVPGDYQTIYDIKPLIASGIDGTGVTIGIVGQTNIDASQVATFRSLSGLPAKTITPQVIGDDPLRNGDEGEAQLDLQWSGAAAPNANIVFITSTDVVSSLQYAVDNNVASILSMSYGSCEANASANDAAYYDALGQEANAMGITIVVSSGDSGATGCELAGVDGNGNALTTSATTGLSANILASSTHITSVGGTAFNEGAGSYWSASNGTTFASALSYIPEIVWNETSSTHGVLATGGGVSQYIAKPAWQTGTGVPADGARDQPDIALTSAVYQDPYLICFTGYCTNGFANSGGSLYAIGGTSAATPSFAGILALVQQKTKSTGLGNINPTLYALANNSALAKNVFHDITTGDNKIPCTAGSKNCPAGTTSIGYSAGAGYDLATGWGSVDAMNLVNSWSQVTPLPNTGSTASATTLTTAATGVLNGAFNVTIKVASASAASTTAPTGYVAVQVNNNGTLTYVSLSGGSYTSGTGALTLDSSYFKAGANTVVAKYLGDGTYAPSTSAVQTVTISNPTASSTTALTSSVTNGAIGAATNLSVTVASATAGVTAVPTGVVDFRVTNSTFTNGIGLGSLTLRNGVASLTGFALSSGNYFVVGTNTLTAIYKGDGNYLTSSNPITITLTNPGTLSMTPATSTVTVASGSTAAPVTLTATSLNGYAGPITFSASTNSSTLNASYTFNPSSGTIAAGGTLATSFTLQASSGPSSNGARPVAAFRNQIADKGHGAWPVAAGGTALASLLFLMLPRRRRWMPLLLVVLAIGTFGLNGCGGSSSSGSGITKTTPGTYTITVTATGSTSAVVAQSTITFVVQ